MLFLIEKQYLLRIELARYGDDASSRLAPGFISVDLSMDTPNFPKGASPFRKL